MVRKGYPKVRTGCLTCKKRKVKCDEAHPVCDRCTTTGRTCDGYSRSTPFTYSWQELLAPRMLLVSDVSAAYIDRRSMASFHKAVTNTLSSSLGGSAWIRRLTQLALNEPAVTHAALAISVLYNQFTETQPTTQQLPRENPRAIQHYNAAIRCMLTSSMSSSRDTTLLLCALFVCIEFLRCDAMAAITHCQHGIHLLNSQRGESGVAPIFYHWSILPFFYHRTIPSFPRLKEPGFPTTTAFTNVTQAQETIDWLAARALHLGRAGDDYRLAPESSVPLSTELIRERTKLAEALRSWSLAFTRLCEAIKLSPEVTARLLLLEMRWLVWEVYVNTCLEQNEMGFDAYMHQFQRVLQISAQLRAANVPDQIFNLEIGYYTSLYFIVVNCRHLKTRLSALLMLKTASQAKEMLWNVGTFYAIGKNLIEIEHELELTAKVIKTRGNSVRRLGLPPDRQRIRGTIVESDTTLQLNSGGMQMPVQNAHFMMLGQDGRSIYNLTRDISCDTIWTN